MRRPLSWKHKLPLLGASLALAACAGSEARRVHDLTRVPSPAPLLPVTRGDSVLDVHRGFEVEAFARGLDFPAGITFDEKGNAYVIEAGGFLGMNAARTPPRLVTIAPTGERTTVELKGEPVVFPATGIAWYAGGLFISHRDERHLGVISRVELDGTATPIVRDLPSRGDHGTNQIIMGHDGKLYFSQGTATNSGVVGLDDFLAFGWPQVYPDVHDVPAKNLILTGKNFMTGDPRGAVFGHWAVTGSFMPFGVPCDRGAEVKGDVRSNGSILRCDPDGKNLEVYAWGLRNPYGLAVSPTDGQVYATCQGMDARGSRPVANDVDALLRIAHGQWYGWPDYTTDLRPLLDNDEHAPPASLGLPAEPVVDLKRSDVGTPSHADLFARFEPHVNASGFAWAPPEFGELGGRVFVAELGPLSPRDADELQGCRVVVLDGDAKAHDFLRNRRELPASYQGAMGRGLERPIDVKFGPDGALYVIDYGVVRLGLDRNAGLSVLAREGTGTIWRVWPAGARPKVKTTQATEMSKGPAGRS